MLNFSKNMHKMLVVRAFCMHIFCKNLHFFQKNEKFSIFLLKITFFHEKKFFVIEKLPHKK